VLYKIDSASEDPSVEHHQKYINQEEGKQ